MPNASNAQNGNASNRFVLEFASEAWPWARSSQARSRSKMLGSERLQYPLIQEFMLNFSRNSNMI